MSDNHALRPDPEQPTDELLLAQSLETCLRAEHVLPGSSEAIVARVPDPARSELSKLLATARLVEAAAASATPSPEFKAAARARLMRKISTGVDEPTQPVPIVLASIPGRGRGPARRRWLLRGIGGLAAAGLTAAATLTASASALPGEPLYSVKQAKEEIAVRMASDDQARALALVQRANARLDETTRLLQQGRTEDALQAAAQYDESVDRATSTLVTALGPQPGTTPAAEKFAVALAEQQVQIENVLPEAPPEAQAELREALQTAERSRALAANPAPVKQALAQPIVPTQAAPVVAPPRVEATIERQPTQAPTFTALPPTAVVAHEPEPEPEVARVEDARDEDRGGRDTAEASGPSGRGSGDDQRGGGPGPQTAPRVPAPAQVARPAAQPKPSTSGRGPSEDQRGGDDDGSNDRGGNVDQRGGPASGDDQRGGAAVAEDQRGSSDEQRGGGDDRRRGGDGQQPQQAQSQQQAPTQAPTQPATQVARGQDGGDGQHGGSQATSVAQSGSGDGSSQARATTAPVAPLTAGRGDGGDQNQNARRGDDQVAVKPSVPLQPTVQQQPTRPAPTATPTRQQNTPQTQQTQSPQQTQNPALQNNNRAPATSTTTNRTGGGRSGNDDDSGSKGGR